MYYGMRSLIDEFGYSFAGIKGQRELTEHYSTSDLPEAFLNDYYGPDGEPLTVCLRNELTWMCTNNAVFNHVSGGKPVLFADIRNYYDT